MGRRLPEYNPETDGPYNLSKRRAQIFKSIYRHMQHWKALQEDHGMSNVITTVDGEEVYYWDLMTGIDTLPLQQLRAFNLICLKGYTQEAAKEEFLSHSKWSSPVQQYSDDGLKKMIAAYDQKQEGTWDPTNIKRRKSRRRTSSETNENKSIS